MIIEFQDGRKYDVGDPVRTFRGVTVDLSKATEWENDDIMSDEGELGRLILDPMNHDGYTTTNLATGEEIQVPPKTDGIDMTVASDEELTNYVCQEPWCQLKFRLMSEYANTVVYLAEISFGKNRPRVVEEYT